MSVSAAKRRIISFPWGLLTTRFRIPSRMKNCSMLVLPWRTRGSPFLYSATSNSGSRSSQADAGISRRIRFCLSCRRIVLRWGWLRMADGFQLVIDALKLNGLDTIYGLPGIPITDLTRRAQAAGMRVLSFRHEQNAGYAASIAGFLTQKPGICLTVSAPGFLNGLNALAHATVNCFPMILISGSSEREIVDLQQGDYEEMDQLAIAKPVAKAAYRVP